VYGFKYPYINWFSIDSLVFHILYFQTGKIRFFFL
jgi:hypothetical protein